MVDRREGGQKVEGKKDRPGGHCRRSRKRARKGGGVRRYTGGEAG